MATTVKKTAPKAGQPGFIGPLKVAPLPKVNLSLPSMSSGGTIKTSTNLLSPAVAKQASSGGLADTTSSQPGAYSTRSNSTPPPVYKGQAYNAQGKVIASGSSINLLSPAVANQVATGGFQNLSGTSTQTNSVQRSNLASGITSSPTTNVMGVQDLSPSNTKLTFPEPKVTDYSMDIPTPIEQQRLDLEAEQKGTQEDYISQLLKDYNQKESASDIDRKLQKQLGIKEKQQAVSDLTGQLNGIVAKGQANQLSLTGQGRGIPEAIIGGQQAEIGRETAIAALPVQAQLSAAQGNLEMANDSLDRLFKIYSEEAQNEFDFKREVRTKVYEFATADQKRKLDVLDKQEARALQERDAMLVDGKSYAKMAFANGQSALGAKIMGLDIKSPTYQRDLVNLISQVKDPNFQLDVQIKQQQLANLQKQNSLLGEPTAAEKKATASALQNAKSSIPIMNDKIEAVDALLTNNGLPSRVGTNILSRTPKGFRGTAGKALTGVGLLELPFDAYSMLSGLGQSFAGGVHKLVSGLTLDSLIAAKARGATFGALSEGELNILANSASAINDWEIKDGKGNGTGIWNIDEGTFKTELKSIQDLTRRAILLSQGTILTQDEQGIINTTFSPDNMPIDPSNYY